MTDDEIIQYMTKVKDFELNLRSQIGEIKRTYVDRDNGHIVFFGEKRACTFQLNQILLSYEQELKKPCQGRKVAFR